MLNWYKGLPPLLKTLLVIAVLALLVMAVSLWLFPEWRTTPAWLFMLFWVAVIGVTAFLDTLSGARSLVAPETSPETGVTIQVVIEQTTMAILGQMNQRQFSVSREALAEATIRYLSYLVERYQILDFKGMGIDRVIALPLLKMYVPLRARIELPKGETWDRSVKVGGSQLPDEKMQRLSDPQSVLDLLQQHDGLIILGDPGAGKTTFLRYVAVRLALGEGDALGMGNRLPILVRLSAYAEELAKGDVPLDDFISQYYNDVGMELPLTALFEEALKQGRVMFLLDGLDEVQSLRQRGLVAERFLDYFIFHRKVGNKFALTSRIIGYDEVRPVNEELRECTLVDFDQDDIESFVNKWTMALEKAIRGGNTIGSVADAQQEKRELLEAIGRHAGVRRLATNPLLLTILALMKRQGVTLPERRVELYNKYIETLIRHWNQTRGPARGPGRELDYGMTVQVLAELALWMHQNSPGISLAPQEEVKRQLTAIYARRGVPEADDKAKQLLIDAREYAGLLVARGQREYGFIHLTFQEYLAAIGIAQQEDDSLTPVVAWLARYIGDDNWHEVTLLAVAYVGIIQQREKPASRILQQLIEDAPGAPGEAVVLAGQIVADMSPGGVTLLFRDRITDKLIEIMQSSEVALSRRAQAGRVLGQMTRANGTSQDSRPGVGYTVGSNGEKIPDIAWGKEVPAGTYMIGGDSQAYQSFESKEVTIDHPFKLAQYPVTYAQFQCFVEAEDFDNPEWWAGMSTNRRGLSEQAFPFANHPRDSVSWYQATAFCRWLSDKLGYKVELPHEYEWEVAARWPDGRHYPWGDEFDEKRANTHEGGIGQATAVGMYPSGQNEALGLYDLSGNVWEWCRNKYSDPKDDAVDESGDERVLRGGSWLFNQSLARASYRLYYDPDNRLDGRRFRLGVVVRPPSQGH